MLFMLQTEYFEMIPDEINVSDDKLTITKDKSADSGWYNTSYGKIAISSTSKKIATWTLRTNKNGDPANMCLGFALDVIKKSRKAYPNIGFITLTMHDEGQYVTKAVRSGADGYLLKNADEDQVIEAIFKVHQGGKFFPSDVSQLMIDSITMEGDVKQLSQREKEVLDKVAEGKTTKEIADELIVSTRTVETHRANMMKTLDVQNSAELIKKAAKLGLI